VGNSNALLTTRFKTISLQYLSIFSVLIPVVIGLSISTRLDKNSSWIVLLVILASIPQLSALVLPELSPYRNVLYNLYILCDATILALVFFLNSRIKAVKAVIAMIAALQLLGITWTFTSIGLASEFASQFVCLNSLFQVLWVLTYFYERYMSDKIGSIEREPMFWFCLGILLYAPTTYFLFAYYKVIKLSKDPNVFQLWNLHNFLNICMYVLFTVGIGINLLRQPNQKNAHS
jgi:hypothetical protein